MPDDDYDVEEGDEDDAIYDELDTGANDSSDEENVTEEKE